MWKVYNIQSGKIVKAGFESDDQAKEWLERRKDLADDEFDVDEMDEEEEEEYLEENEEQDDQVYDVEDEEDGVPRTFGHGFAGDLTDEDADLGDEDEGDNEEEEDEEDEDDDY